MESGERTQVLRGLQPPPLPCPTMNDEIPTILQSQGNRGVQDSPVPGWGGFRTLGGGAAAPNPIQPRGTRIERGAAVYPYPKALLSSAGDKGGSSAPTVLGWGIQPLSPP